MHVHTYAFIHSRIHTLTLTHACTHAQMLMLIYDCINLQNSQRGVSFPTSVNCRKFNRRSTAQVGLNLSSLWPNCGGVALVSCKKYPFISIFETIKMSNIFVNESTCFFRLEQLKKVNLSMLLSNTILECVPVCLNIFNNWMAKDER